MLTALDTQTALVLIDLQKGIATDGKAHPTETIIRNAARLKEAFHRAKRPVVVVHVEPIGAPASVVRSEKGNFPKDADGQKQAQENMQASGFFDLVDPIKPNSDDIRITKETWNAFYNTSLHEELQKRTITGIVLAGISTSIGVEGTARSANERGYNITFATDAMTDTVAAAHENSLTYIFPRIGELATTDEIIAQLPLASPNG
jgi:nicotinamidase-related amidase